MLWYLNCETRQHTDPPPVDHRMPSWKTKLFPLDADLMSRSDPEKAFGAEGAEGRLFLSRP